VVRLPRGLSSSSIALPAVPFTTGRRPNAVTVPPSTVITHHAARIHTSERRDKANSGMVGKNMPPEFFALDVFALLPSDIRAVQFNRVGKKQHRGFLARLAVLCHASIG
jgi:hypothetical protein